MNTMMRARMTRKLGNGREESQFSASACSPGTMTVVFFVVEVSLEWIEEEESRLRATIHTQTA
jgi:hypothetical protein